MRENDIYNDIRERLASCKTVADYIDAYKWLAGAFVEVNESAKDFENRAKEMLGERQFGILLYGSEAAYEKELDFNRRILEAKTPEAKQAVMLQMLFDEDIAREPESESINLWDKEDGRQTNDDFER